MKPAPAEVEAAPPPPEPIGKPSDLVSGGIATAAGIFMTVTSQFIPEARHVVQPSYLPLGVGVGLIICGLVLAARGWLARRRSHSADPAASTAVVGTEARSSETADAERAAVDEILDESNEDTTGNRTRWLVMVGILTVYAIILIPVGYIISTVAFLFGGTMYIDRKHPVRNAIFAVVFTAIVFVLFNNILKVILPPGILEGLF